MASRDSWRGRVLIALVTVFMTTAPAPGAAKARSVSLRVNDADARAGDIVTVVLRTLSARPIRQGRITVRVKARPNRRQAASSPLPFELLESYSVFSGSDDAVAVASLTTEGKAQAATIQFTSASGSVNQSDGPLAILNLRVNRRLVPGDTFDLDIQATEVSLEGTDGTVVDVVPVSGLMRVHSASQRPRLSVDPGEAEIGDDARFGIQTSDAMPMTAGRIVFNYDPAIADGEPQVRLNNKYGVRSFTADVSMPGRVDVEFTSRTGDFNAIPGEIVSVRLPLKAGLLPGPSPITFDRALTFFLDAAGLPLAFRFGDGTLELQTEDDEGDDGADDAGDSDDGGGGGDDGGGGGDDGGDDGGGGGDDGGDDDGDDDGDDATVEFEARALTADPTTGLIGLSDGTLVLVNLGTTWDGDLQSVAAIANALTIGQDVRVKGKGERDSAGRVVAISIETELDD